MFGGVCMYVCMHRCVRKQSVGPPVRQQVIRHTRPKSAQRVHIKFRSSKFGFIWGVGDARHPSS